MATCHSPEQKRELMVVSIHGQPQTKKQKVEENDIATHSTQIRVMHNNNIIIRGGSRISKGEGLMINHYRYA
jgi:hypothetical protein